MKFVGGKVERGETKEQALIRECQEELAEYQESKSLEELADLLKKVREEC